MDDLTVQRMSQFLTAEHSMLQGARNGTISEANGRLSAFLSTVASGIIALAFVADVANLGGIFLIFSTFIFPILIFLGITTAIRLANLGVTDVLLIQAINRIRHYYLEVTPKAEKYFSFPRYDDPESIRLALLETNSRFEGLGSAVIQVVVINSFLAGIFAGILASGPLSVSLLPTILIGLSGLVIAIVLHLLYLTRLRNTIQDKMETRFPPPGN